MSTEAAGSELISVVTLLAAGVVAVPLFKRIGLGCSATWPPAW